MSTSKHTAPAAELPKQFTDSANAYIERLIQGHERFASALDNARARNARVADKFVEALVAGQRDALSLGKTMLAEPTAYAKNMDAVMHSLSAAQERAVEVAKTVYREQAEAGTALRTAAESAFESGKAWFPSFEKLTSLWAPAAK